MKLKNLVLLIATALLTHVAFGQNNGQMRVVKRSEPLGCVIIDTIEWHGLSYMVFDNPYHPDSASTMCSVPEAPDGNFLVYFSPYETSDGRTAVGYTYQLKNGRMCGTLKVYSEKGVIQCITYFNDSCVLAKYESYSLGNLSYVYFYTDEGLYDLYKKEIHYYPSGSVKWEINYTQAVDSGTNELKNVAVVALNYDTTGVLLFKYDCSSLQLTTLGPNGSVKSVSSVLDCDINPFE